MPEERGAWRALLRTHAAAGLVLVLVGEALITARLRPVSDFSFTFVWFGYILTVDGALLAQRGASPLRVTPGRFLALFPVSAAFWWVFELMNQAVRNWEYVGAGMWTGMSYVGIASLDFSTVLPAVWLTALALDTVVPQHVHRPTSRPVSPQAGGSATRALPDRVGAAAFGAGVLAVVLPVLWPRAAFAMIWLSLFLLLDPINARLGRPSILAAMWNADWRPALRFAPAALICGLLWESWNFWAMPKWIYHVPYVGFLHVFEMPLLGYGGYLPFGLELFAMANFVLPTLGLGPLTLELPESKEARTPTPAPRSGRAEPTPESARG